MYALNFMNCMCVYFSLLTTPTWPAHSSVFRHCSTIKYTIKQNNWNLFTQLLPKILLICSHLGLKKLWQWLFKNSTKPQNISSMPSFFSYYQIGTCMSVHSCTPVCMDINIFKSRDESIRQKWQFVSLHHSSVIFLTTEIVMELFLYLFFLSFSSVMNVSLSDAHWFMCPFCEPQISALLVFLAACLAMAFTPRWLIL